MTESRPLVRLRASSTRAFGHGYLYSLLALRFREDGIYSLRSQQQKELKQRKKGVGLKRQYNMRSSLQVLIKKNSELKL